jgi:hypothetical protein
LARPDRWQLSELPSFDASSGTRSAGSWARSEVDRIRARMVALQLIYQRKKKVVIALRQRFWLLQR